MAVSGDGRHIATSSRSTIAIVRLDERAAAASALIACTAPVAHVTALALSPDATRLIVSDSTDVFVLDGTDGRVIASVTPIAGAAVLKSANGFLAPETGRPSLRWRAGYDLLARDAPEVAAQWANRLTKLALSAPTDKVDRRAP